MLSLWYFALKIPSYLPEDYIQYKSYAQSFSILIIIDSYHLKILLQVMVQDKLNVEKNRQM